MTVNMVVAGRYNATRMAEALFPEVDLRVYSSVPASHWGKARPAVRFIPHASLLWHRATGRSPSRRFRDLSTRLFARAAARVMRDADVLYAWATFGRESMARMKNRASLILDRACPHILEQEEVLGQEADALGMRFDRSSRAFVNRCLAEYELSDFIVTPSNYTRESFIRRNIPPSRLMLIRLPPSFEPTMADVRRPKGEFVVGTVATSVLRKGLRYLVDAWESLSLPDARLQIRCPVAELRKVPQLYSRIAANPTIHVVEYQTNLQAFYRECDLFCLPSVDEGFGMVVLEAIACGCPVLVTESVGASDLVANGTTGFIVSPRDADALSDAIRRAYDDRAGLGLMGRACSEFYTQYSGAGGAHDLGVQALLRTLHGQRRQGSLEGH